MKALQIILLIGLMLIGKASNDNKPSPQNIQKNAPVEVGKHYQGGKLNSNNRSNSKRLLADEKELEGAKKDSITKRKRMSDEPVEDEEMIQRLQEILDQNQFYPNRRLTNEKVDYYYLYHNKSKFDESANKKIQELYKEILKRKRMTDEPERVIQRLQEILDRHQFYPNNTKNGKKDHDYLYLNKPKLKSSSNKTIQELYKKIIALEDAPPEKKMIQRLQDILKKHQFYPKRRSTHGYNDYSYLLNNKSTLKASTDKRVKELYKQIMSMGNDPALSEEQKMIQRLQKILDRHKSYPKRTYTSKNWKDYYYLYNNRANLKASTDETIQELYKKINAMKTKEIDEDDEIEEGSSHVDEKIDENVGIESDERSSDSSDGKSETLIKLTLKASPRIDEEIEVSDSNNMRDTVNHSNYTSDTTQDIGNDNDQHSTIINANKNSYAKDNNDQQNLKPDIVMKNSSVKIPRTKVVPIIYKSRKPIANKSKLNSDVSDENDTAHAKKEIYKNSETNKSKSDADLDFTEEFAKEEQGMEKKKEYINLADQNVNSCSDCSENQLIAFIVSDNEQENALADMKNLTEQNISQTKTINLKDVKMIQFQGIYASQNVLDVTGTNLNNHLIITDNDKIDFEIFWPNDWYPFNFYDNKNREKLQKIIEKNLKKQMPALLKTKLSEGKTEDMVEVKPSEGKGSGLFAKKQFSPGDIIGLFNGQRYTAKEYGQLIKPFAREDYILNIPVKNKKNKPENIIIDPFYKSGIVNDCRSDLDELPTDADLEAQNVLWITFRYKKIVYVAEVAIKKIDQEMELLTYYGPKYQKLRIEMKDAETFIEKLSISKKSKKELLRLHQQIEDNSSYFLAKGCKSEGDVQTELLLIVPWLKKQPLERLADLYYNYNLEEESKSNMKRKRENEDTTDIYITEELLEGTNTYQKSKIDASKNVKYTTNTEAIDETSNYDITFPERIQIEEAPNTIQGIYEKNYDKKYLNYYAHTENPQYELYLCKTKKLWFLRDREHGVHIYQSNQEISFQKNSKEHTMEIIDKSRNKKYKDHKPLKVSYKKIQIYAQSIPAMKASRLYQKMLKMNTKKDVLDTESKTDKRKNYISDIEWLNDDILNKYDNDD